jgi:hypothetical protein
MLSQPQAVTDFIVKAAKTPSEGKATRAAMIATAKVPQEARNVA